MSHNSDEGLSSQEDHVSCWLRVQGLGFGSPKAHVPSEVLDPKPEILRFRHIGLKVDFPVLRAFVGISL